MAIGRTARGTFSGLVVSSPSYGPITIGSGSALLVEIAYDDGGGGPADGISWNGSALTQVGTTQSVSFGYHETWVLVNATAGSATIDFDLSSAGSWNSLAITATEITGCTTSPLDVNHSATGSGTSPSSGATGTTAQANEIAVGSIMWAGTTSVIGSWGASFSAGQNVTVGALTTGLALEEGYKTLSSTGTVTASKSSAVNKPWAASVVTFKEAAGGSPQTSTPSALHTAARVATVALVLGAVMSSCTAITNPSREPAVTTIAGAVMTTPIPAHAASRVPDPEPGQTCYVGPVLGSYRVPAATFLQSGPYDPQANTIFAVQQDGGSTPVVLRSNTSPFGDQNLGTFTSESSVYGVASGTLSFSVGGFAHTSIAGSGQIAGVVFYAFARVRHDPHATVSAFKIYNVATTAQPPAGPYSAVPAFGQVNTALVTTAAGGGAWDWSVLYSQLDNALVTASYSFSGGHQLDEFCQVDLAEVWCEVWGPQGVAPEIIFIKQPMGPLPVQQTIDKVSVAQPVPGVVTFGGN